MKKIALILLLSLAACAPDACGRERLRFRERRMDREYGGYPELDVHAAPYAGPVGQPGCVGVIPQARVEYPTTQPVQPAPIVWQSPAPVYQQPVYATTQPQPQPNYVVVAAPAPQPVQQQPLLVVVEPPAPEPVLVPVMIVQPDPPPPVVVAIPAPAPAPTPVAVVVANPQPNPPPVVVVQPPQQPVYTPPPTQLPAQPRYFPSATPYAVPPCAGPTCQPQPYALGREVTTYRAIDRLNSRRARSGLFPLVEDPHLTQLARSKSVHRAGYRIRGHDGSSFPGARGEGVGWGSGEFNTCYWNTRRHRYGGAATEYDVSGRPYHTLLVR